MVPNRLSYSEMALDSFLYTSDWNISYEAYLKNKHLVINKITDYVENYSKYLGSVKEQELLLKDYFSGKKLYETIKHNS